MQSNQDLYATNNEGVEFDWMNPLLTDMYQIKMCYASWKGNRHDETAIFEMFFRKCPFKGKYAIFCGHEEVYKFLDTYKFTPQHIEFLKMSIPHAEPEFFEYLSNLDCSSIKIRGMPEGEIVFPEEPLFSLEGPIVLLQLIETPLLNMTNFSTLLCTNATRMVQVAGNSKCVEFGLRRAQGPNGAMIASKFSYLGGFVGTSNVYAAYLNGIPSLGTVAHSYIMSFEKEEDIANTRVVDGVDLLEAAMKYRTELGWNETNMGELYAYVGFAYAYPTAFSALVDSYSTMNSGIKNYLLLALVLKDLGYTVGGIRLDSGDLA